MSLLVLAALPAMAANRIAAIDFFGYKGIDVEKIRAALPVKVGDPVDQTNPARAGETFLAIADVVEKQTGAPPTDISLTCCMGDNDVIVFIGLRGSSFRQVPSRPAPQGTALMPDSILALYDRLMAVLFEVVQTDSREDRSQGYALSDNGRLRGLQLELRAWAVEHEAEILAAMESSQPAHRRVAAHALGYANRSARQVGVLVQATRDPDGTVRNNATRALDVLVAADAALAQSIDPVHFAAMLQSGSWSDRNKAVWFVEQATVSPNPALLDLLRAEAVDALREMAAWKSHGDSARKILERIGK